MSVPVEIRVQRAPILWLLGPIVAGYALCEIGFAFESTWAQIAALALAGTLILLAFFCRKKSKSWWSLTFFVGLAFVAGTWWSVRAPKILRTENAFPQSEIFTTIAVEKTFRSSGKSWTGLARLREENPASAFENSRVFFMLPKENFEQMPVENQKIRIAGTLSALEDEVWILDDFHDYLSGQRTSFVLKNCVPAGEKIDDSIGAKWSIFCRNFRDKITENLVKIGGRARERESRILCAMMFGDRAQLPEIERKNFQLTGTMHVFAVSGLHIAIVTLVISWFFSIFRLRERTFVIAVLACSWLYVQLAGGVPAASRAWMMIAFYYVGKLAGHGRFTVPAISLVALINLLWKPWLLGDLGFQLSYCVVFGLFLYAVPFTNWLEKFAKIGGANSGVPAEFLTFWPRIWQKIKLNCVGGLAISWTSFLATSLLIAGTMNLFTPTSILVNIFLLPVVGVMLPIAIISAILVVIPFAGTLLAIPFWWIACRLALFCEWLTGTVAGGVGAIEMKLAFPWLAQLGTFLILASFFVGNDWRFLRERPLLRFSVPAILLAIFLII